MRVNGILRYRKLMTEDWQRVETRGVATSAEAFALSYNHIGKWGHGFGQKQTGMFKCRDDRVMDFRGGVDGITWDRGMREC